MRRDGEAVVRAGNLLAGIRIRVTGLNGAILRVRVAQAIFRFGALVAGCAIEIALDDTRGPNGIQ